MSIDEAMIHIVDDEQDVIDSLRWLIEADGLELTAYNNATDFLTQYAPSSPECLILDVRMPGMSGLELQEQLRQKKIDLPVIFMTGHGNVAMAVRAMKAGAQDFLIKPFSDQFLLEAIHKAIQHDKQQHERRMERSVIEKRIAQLTPREYEVMGFVVNGTLNKNISHELGIGPKTVEIHRARIMRKMQARSLAELVKMAIKYESA